MQFFLHNYIQRKDPKLNPIQGISIFRDLIKQPGTLLCFEVVSQQMVA